MTMFENNWTKVGMLSDIPQRGARVVRTSSGDVAVFRTANDQILAIKDRCPHQGGPLSQGIVHGTHVTCPLHNWVIDLVTGGVVGPDQGCVLTIPVKIENETIFLDLTMMSKKVA